MTGTRPHGVSPCSQAAGTAVGRYPRSNGSIAAARGKDRSVAEWVSMGGAAATRWWFSR